MLEAVSAAVTVASQHCAIHLVSTVLPTFWTVRNTRTNDEVEIFNAGIEVSARVNFANVSSKGAVGLVEMVLGARISDIDQVIKVVVPGRISGEHWIVRGGRQENGSSLSGEVIFRLGLERWRCTNTLPASDHASAQQL